MGRQHLLSISKASSTLKINRKRNLRKGITLIELVIVVMLLAAMITIFSTSIPSLLKSATNENSETLQVFLDYSYNFAMLKNTTTVVEINLDKQTLTVYAITISEEGLEKKKLKHTELSESAGIVKIYNMAGQEFVSGIVEVPFNFDGTSENYIFCLGSPSNIRLSLLNYKYNRRIVVKKGEVSSFENQ